MVGNQVFCLEMRKIARKKYFFCNYFWWFRVIYVFLQNINEY